MSCLLSIRFFSTNPSVKFLQSYFVFTAAKKFDIPTLNLKVYDDTKTEIDEDVFELLSAGDMFVQKFAKSQW